MPHVKFTFTASGEQQEILLAYLQGLAFENFEEQEEALAAFLPQEGVNDELLKSVATLASQFQVPYQKEVIPDQNWNAIWEASFHPIRVGDFCRIRADFHDRDKKVRHEITINPKMAFGTGHHDTTYMMIQSMESIDFQGLKVLDYGCGTGVLAILAAKLDAKVVVAVDIDPLSYENTLENSQLNETTDCIDVHCGTLEVITENEFDCILANINRHVILNQLDTLYLKTKPGGQVLISGILAQDETLVMETAAKAGFVSEGIRRSNNWLCISLGTCN